VTAEPFGIEVDSRAQADLYDVVGILRRAGVTVVDSPHVALVPQHPFTTEKSGCQLEVVARGPHGDGDTVPLPLAPDLSHDPDLQRLFGRHRICPFNRLVPLHCNYPGGYRGAGSTLALAVVTHHELETSGATAGMPW
jgi:hypothetical protein